MGCVCVHTSTHVQTHTHTHISTHKEALAVNNKGYLSLQVRRGLKQGRKTRLTALTAVQKHILSWILKANRLGHD